MSTRTIAIDRETARAEVAATLQWTVYPSLTPLEVYALVDDTLRCSFWLADTVYVAGDVVLPATSNGHRYICLTGGTSTATEPEWSVCRLSTTSDGDDLIWVEDGRAYRNVHDIKQAIHDGWLVKAAKAAKEVDATLAGGASAGTFSAKANQIYEHCIQMADRWKPYRIT